MPLIQLIVLLVLVGVILWAINNYIPMQPTIKRIVNIVVIIIVVIWLLNIFGLLGGISGINVGSHHG